MLKKNNKLTTKLNVLLYKMMLESWFY